MAHLPSDHCSPLGAFSEVDPLGCLKMNKFTYNILLMPITNCINDIEIHSRLLI